jgi:hypothetical protein
MKKRERCRESNKKIIEKKIKRIKVKKERERVVRVTVRCGIAGRRKAKNE